MSMCCDFMYHLVFFVQLVGVVTHFFKSENSDETYSTNADLIRFVSNFGWQSKRAQQQQRPQLYCVKFNAFVRHSAINVSKNNDTRTIGYSASECAREHQPREYLADITILTLSSLFYNDGRLS